MVTVSKCQCLATLYSHRRDNNIGLGNAQSQLAPKQRLDGILHASLTFLVLHQQQNLGRRFGISKMHLSTPVAYADVRSKAVVLLLNFCYSHCHSM